MQAQIKNPPKLLPGANLSNTTAPQQTAKIVPITLTIRISQPFHIQEFERASHAFQPLFHGVVCKVL